MEKYGTKRARKFRGRDMTGVAIGNTYALASRWVEILKGLKPKWIAERIGASHRTVENWQDGDNGPTWKYTVAMLNDDVLAPLVLTAAGREDLAKHDEILSLERRIEALKQAEQRHREHTNEIRMDLEAARTPDPLGSGQVERRGDLAAHPGGAAEKPGDEGGE